MTTPCRNRTHSPTLAGGRWSCAMCETAPVELPQSHVAQVKARTLAAVNDAAPDDIKARIDAAILRLAATGREFSANDCRHEFPGVNTAVIGGRFSALGFAKRIRKTGQKVPSTLGNTHGHEIHVWVGTAAQNAA